MTHPSGCGIQNWSSHFCRTALYSLVEPKFPLGKIVSFSILAIRIEKRKPMKITLVTCLGSQSQGGGDWASKFMGGGSGSSGSGGSPWPGGGAAAGAGAGPWPGMSGGQGGNGQQGQQKRSVYPRQQLLMARQGWQTKARDQQFGAGAQDQGSQPQSGGAGAAPPPPPSSGGSGGDSFWAGLGSKASSFFGAPPPPPPPPPPPQQTGLGTNPVVICYFRYCNYMSPLNSYGCHGQSETGLMNNYFHI